MINCRKKIPPLQENERRISTMLTRLDDVYQLSLLGNWVLDKHREDMQYFDKSLFEDYKNLYKGVTEGKQPTQLLAEKLLDGVTITDLMSFGTANLGDDYPMYAESRAKALIVQRAIYAEKIGDTNTTDTRLLTARIEELTAVINGEEYKPIATNYKEALFKELDERAEEKIAHYGKGFKFVDEFMEGIHRGQLTVLGARPRVGKSAMALQVARNVADEGYKVLFIPLEMTVNENLQRILLNSQLVEPQELRTGSFDRETVGAYLDELEKNLKFCESLNSLEGIEKIIKAEKPYLVVIDQLSQITIKGSHKDNREKYIVITRALKRIAMEQKVAILLLSQLNRASTDKNKPSLESLHESDSTGQDADNVLLLYTPHDEEDTDSPERETFLRIAKQRNGISGKDIPLMYRGERFTFSPVDTSKRTLAQFVEENIRY
jgi:replicative DNA helicase